MLKPGPLLRAYCPGCGHGLAWVVIGSGERLSLERLQEIVAGLEASRPREQENA